MSNIGSVSGSSNVHPIHSNLNNDQPSQIDHGVTRPLSEQISQAERIGGVLGSHLEGLKKLADEKQVCIAIRSVSTEATGLIREGFGTKDMGVKGKSSILPPLSALIPFKQEWGKKPALAEKLTKENQDSIDGRKATKVPLELSMDRIRELVNRSGKATLEIQGTWLAGSLDGSDTVRSGVMVGSDGERTVAFWGEVTDKGVAIFEAIPAENDTFTKGDPVEVMADRNGKPVTADYDLAFVAPRFEDYGPEHTRPLKVTSFEEMQKISRIGQEDTSLIIRRSTPERRHEPTGDGVKQTYGGMVKKQLEEEYSSWVDDRENTTMRPYDRNETTDGKMPEPMRSFGNISNFTRNLLPELNRSCGRGEGNAVFHHSDDAGNPFSQEADNYPMTLIVPSSMTSGGGESVRVVENHDQLIEAFREMKNADFIPIGNQRWGDDLMGVRSDRFEESRDILRGMFEGPSRSDAPEMWRPTGGPDGSSSPDDPSPSVQSPTNDTRVKPLPEDLPQSVPTVEERKSSLKQSIERSSINPSRDIVETKVSVKDLAAKFQKSDEQKPEPTLERVPAQTETVKDLLGFWNTVGKPV